MSGLPHPGLAQVVPSTTAVPAGVGNTNAYVSPNGVTVVNINTANSAGVSNNVFTRYDVPTNGQVLNNGNSSQVFRQSQLAGQVAANLNLQAEAKVILNQVVSPNRSVLQGFVEVLGGKADVIVANPYGITCSGCGFINTDRLTLTTGVPTLGADGKVSSFAVNSGDVLINGAGLNATAQQLLDIVTRSVQVDAQINLGTTGSLGMTTGPNQWDYQTREVTGSTTGTGSAPSYAIDSTVLGGIYAGSVRLIATEAGVGVRMLADAAATASDFTVRSDGKIELRAKVSAERDVALSSTAAGADAIGLTDTKLSGKRHVSLTAISGGATLEAGSVVAGADLTMSVGTLTDRKNDAGSDADQNKRFGNNVTLSATGAALIDGVSWGASNRLSANLASLDVDALHGASLYAGSTLDLTSTGNMNLNGAALQSVGDLALTTTGGQITTTAGAAQGVKSSAGKITISANQGLSNAGVITADAGQMAIAVSGVINNTGTLHSQGTLSIKDQNLAATQNVSNSGTLITEGLLTLDGAQITNTQSIQSALGTTVQADSLLNSGVWIASQSSGAADVFTLNSLTNSATIQSIQDLTLNVTSSLNNSGKLLASNNLTVLSGASAAAISNTATGVLQAGNALTVTGASANLNTQAGSVLGNTVALTLASLNNSGTVQSEAAMSYAISGAASNSGVVLAKTTLTGSSASLTNSGTLQATTGAALTATNAVSNTGTVLFSTTSGNGTLNAATLDNSSAGVLQSANNLNINLSGATLSNAGKVIADNNLTLNATGSGLTLTNSSGAYLQAGILSGNVLSISGNSVALQNNAGGTVLGNTLGLTLASLDNSGTVQSEAAMSYAVSGAVSNSGVVLAKTTLTGNSASLSNSGTLQANTGAGLTATNAASNTGIVLFSTTSGNGTLNAATLDNNSAGVLQSANNLSMNLSGATLSNAGKVIASHNLTLSSTGSGLTLTNLSGAYLQAGILSGDALSISGNSVALQNNAGGTVLGNTLGLTLASLNNSGTVQSEAAMSYTISGAASNSGVVLAKTTLTSNSASLSNSGTLQANTGAALTATNAVSNTGTLLLSTTASNGTLTSATLDNSSTGVLQSMGSLDINLSGGALTNSGKLLANNDLTLNASSSPLLVSNRSGGYLQTGVGSGGTLKLIGTPISLDNAVNAVVLVGSTPTWNLASLNNAGTLQSEAGLNYSASGAVTNSGTLLAKGSLTGSSASLSNSGTLQANTGATLTAGAVTNTGNLLLAADAGYSGTLTATTFNNASAAGVLQAANNLSINISGGTLSNSGKIIAGSNLTLNASSSPLLVSNQSGGYMQAGFSASGTLLLTGASIGLDNYVNAVVLVGSTPTLNLSNLNNAGTLQSEASLVYNLSGNASNSGTLLAKGTLTGNSVNLTNSGTIQANQGAALAATNSITNSGAMLLAVNSGNSASLTTAALSNNSSGVIQSVGHLNLNASASSLNNAGKVIAAGDLTFNATGAGLNLTNQSGGYLQAGWSLAMTGAPITLSNQANAVVLMGNAAIGLASLNNAGTFQSEGDMLYSVAGAVTNSGTLLSKGRLTGTQASLTNTAMIQAYQEANLTVNNALDNQGVLLFGATAANSSSTLRAGTLANNGSGSLIQANTQGLALEVSGGTLNNQGHIFSQNDLTITSTGGWLNLTNSAGAYLGAGNALTINGTSVALANNTGAQIGASAATLNLASLTNAGTWVVDTSLNYNVGGSVNNSGVFAALGTMNGTSADLSNSSIIQAAYGGNLQTANTITNTGNLWLSTQGGYSGSLSTNTLSNTGAGLIQSLGNLDINVGASTFNNDAQIAAGGNLNLRRTSGSAWTVSNNAGALLQAGGTLSAGVVGIPLAFNNHANAGVVGNFSINADTLTNDGALQGLSGNSSINVASSLTNSATGTLRTDGGSLTVRGTGATYTIDNAGIWVAGGLLDIKGNNASKNVNLTVRSGALLEGNTLDVRANSLSVQGNGVVASSGNMTLDLNTLAFAGTSSKILGSSASAGTTTITLPSTEIFTNPGVLFSGGNLVFSAQGLVNSVTGGIGASDTLDITAQDGNVTNQGALYAGQSLKVRSTKVGGQLTNEYVGAGKQGTMDSDGSIELTADNFVNNSSINAAQNITVTASAFSNEVKGGDTRAWREKAGSRTAPNNYQTNDWYTFPDNYRTEFYRETWSTEQYFQAGAPEFKPQIIAGGTLHVKDFQTAKNVGGLLSGNTVRLTSSQAGASFLNDALSLQQTNYTKTWERFTHWIALGPAMYDDRLYRNEATNTASVTVDPGSATIRAQTLDASGFSLTNQGSALQAVVSNRPNSSTPNNSLGQLTGNVLQTIGAASVGRPSLLMAAGGDGATGALGSTGGTSMTGGAAAASGTSTIGGAFAASGISTIGGTFAFSGTSAVNASTNTALGITSVNGASGISFGGLVINLPANPNGYFVLDKQPNAKYLVEANPLFQVGSNFVGSDYLAQRYGYNPDTIEKRLGDANYEAYVIRQQLITLTGRNLLTGYANEAAQLKTLMNNGASEAQRLGFQWGQTPSDAQLAQLSEDTVWMIETVVAGEKVLVPKVYLAEQTKQDVQTGAVITAQTANMNLTALTNTGGTISGSKALSITTQGNITNTSGLITGGAVKLTSTAGSIVNQTYVDPSKGAMTVAAGKTAGIVALNNLTMTAAQDISVKGADVIAGGNASLTASNGAITFATVATSSTTKTAGSAKVDDKSVLHIDEGTTTTTEKNIASTLLVGGNLSLKSAGDTTLIGTDAVVGGDLLVDAGGSFQLLAAQDKTTTSSATTVIGQNVGGGVSGTQRTTTTTFAGTNFGSSLTVGGNAAIGAKNQVVLQGSDLAIASNADIAADNGVLVLAGRDESKTQTKTFTQTYLDTNSSNTSSTKAESSSIQNKATGTNEDKAGADAKGGNDNELNFSKTTDQTVTNTTSTSVASNIKVGGNLAITAKDSSLTVQGSNIDAGGNVNLEAKNITVAAAENTNTTSTSTQTYKEGIFTESKSDASADASNKKTSIGNKSEAKAQANGDAVTTMGERTELSNVTQETLLHSASTITAGGNVQIKASEDAKFVGSQVAAAGDLSIEGKNISNEAAVDHDITTESRQRITVGEYVDAQLSASASAQANASPLANANGQADANAESSTGYRAAVDHSTSLSGVTSNQVNSFKAGGNLTRTAQETIKDQGTQLEAGGNINQSAKRLIEEAISNQTFDVALDNHEDLRIGVYAGANANQEVSTIGGSDSSEEATVGVKASFAYTGSQANSGSSLAVTTSYKAGGKIKSSTTEQTTLVGTQMQAGGDIEIEAGELNYQAARNTTTDTNTDRSGDASVKVKLYGTEEGAEVSAAYDQKQGNQGSSTAVAGSLTSGSGAIKIKTKGDARLEGVAIDAAQDVSVASSQGSVRFDAAQDTSTGYDQGFKVNVNVEVGTGTPDVTVGGGYNQRNADEVTKATGVTIKSRSGNVTVSAEKDISLEGANIAATQGNTTLEAGGTVALLEAKTSKQVDGGSFSAEASSDKSFSVAVGAEHQNVQTGTASSISSGGQLTISGKKVINQEASLNSGSGPANITGEQINIAKTNVSEGFEIDLEAKKTGEEDSHNKHEGDGENKPHGDPEQTNHRPEAEQPAPTQPVDPKPHKPVDPPSAEKPPPDMPQESGPQTKPPAPNVAKLPRPTPTEPSEPSELPDDRPDRPQQEKLPRPTPPQLAQPSELTEDGPAPTAKKPIWMPTDPTGSDKMYLTAQERKAAAEDAATRRAAAQAYADQTDALRQAQLARAGLAGTDTATASAATPVKTAAEEAAATRRAAAQAYADQTDALRKAKLARASQLAATDTTATSAASGTSQDADGTQPRPQDRPQLVAFATEVEGAAPCDCELTPGQKGSPPEAAAASTEPGAAGTEIDDVPQPVSVNPQRPDVVKFSAKDGQQRPPPPVVTSRAPAAAAAAAANSHQTLRKQTQEEAQITKTAAGSLTSMGHVVNGHHNTALGNERQKIPGSSQPRGQYDAAVKKTTGSKTMFPEEYTESDVEHSVRSALKNAVVIPGGPADHWIGTDDHGLRIALRIDGVVLKTAFPAPPQYQTEPTPAEKAWLDARRSEVEEKHAQATTRNAQASAQGKEAGEVAKQAQAAEAAQLRRAAEDRQSEQRNAGDIRAELETLIAQDTDDAQTQIQGMNALASKMLDLERQVNELELEKGKDGATGRILAQIDRTQKTAQRELVAATNELKALIAEANKLPDDDNPEEEAALGDSGYSNKAILAAFRTLAQAKASASDDE